MSAVIVCKTKMRNLSHILRAVADIGVPDEHVTVAPAGETIPFNGYGGAKRDVHARISREAYLGYGDVGFTNNEGIFDITMDDLDDRRIGKKFGEKAGFVSALTQHYAAAASQETLEAQGYSVERERADDGTIRIMATSY